MISKLIAVVIGSFLTLFLIFFPMLIGYKDSFFGFAWGLFWGYMMFKKGKGHTVTKGLLYFIMLLLLVKSVLSNNGTYGLYAIIFLIMAALWPTDRSFSK